MNPISMLMKKHNAKKCAHAWDKLSNMIKYQDRVIITLNTTKGYDEFFKKIKEHNYDYRVDDSLKNCVFVSVTKNDKHIYI